MVVVWAAGFGPVEGRRTTRIYLAAAAQENTAKEKKKTAAGDCGLTLTDGQRCWMANERSLTLACDS